MKKPVTLTAILCFQKIINDQHVPTKVKAIETKKIIERKTFINKKNQQ